MFQNYTNIEINCLSKHSLLVGGTSNKIVKQNSPNKLLMKLYDESVLKNNYSEGLSNFILVMEISS